MVENAVKFESDMLKIYRKVFRQLQADIAEYEGEILPAYSDAELDQIVLNKFLCKLPPSMLPPMNKKGEHK